MKTNPPPGPSTGPLENLSALRKDPLAFFRGLHAAHGDLVRFRIGPQDYHLINHPDLIKEVLVTQDRHFSKWFAVDRIRKLLGEGLFVSEGDWHRRQRRLIQPAFHRERISGYATTMTALARRVRERWQDGVTLDVSREMNWLALMIVAETLFGADMEDAAEEINQTLTAILDQFEQSTLGPEEERDFDAWKGRLDAVIFSLITARRKNPDPERQDLLTMLLGLRDEETGEALGDNEVRDEAMTIFLAGHETTANALTWAWHLLAINPEMADEFYRQIDTVLQGREPGLEDLPKLNYVEGVFAEALRLYPPVWAIGRQTLREVTLGEYTLPEGVVVIISLHLTHRDLRFYPEPEKFDPLRWTPAEKTTRPRYSYLPFSAGSRQCLGEGFAWMEGILSLATIAQRWRLEAVGPAPRLQPQLTLRPRNGLRLCPRIRPGLA